MARSSERVEDPLKEQIRADRHEVRERRQKEREGHHRNVLVFDVREFVSNYRIQFFLVESLEEPRRHDDRRVTG